MTIDNQRRPAGRQQPDREVRWVVAAIIAFAIVVAALGAWADALGGNDASSVGPAATATVVPIGAPISP